MVPRALVTEAERGVGGADVTLQASLTPRQPNSVMRWKTESVSAHGRVPKVDFAWNSRVKAHFIL